MQHELGAAERAVAREMRGHPQELGVEERLLHDASRMVAKGADAMEKLNLLESKGRRGRKGGQRSRAGAEARATSGLGARSMAMARAAKMERELNTAERMVARELRGHPRELREEEGLLRQASRMVAKGAGAMGKLNLAEQRARRSEARTSGTKAQEASGVAQLLGIARTEKQLARNGLQAIDEVREIKGEVVEAIGETDPSTAARVEKLMDNVRSQQRTLVQEEDRASRAVERLASEQHSTGHGHQQSLPQQRHGHQQSLRQQRQTVAVADTARSGATLGAQLARFAGEEAHLADDDRSTFREMASVASRAQAALQGSAPETAREVSQLLAFAERSQQKVAMTEHHEARQDRRLAEHLMGHRAGQRQQQQQHHHRHQALQQQHQSVASAASVNSGAALGVRLARFAGQEAHVAENDRSTFHELVDVAGQAQDALQGSSPDAAREVSKLLALAEHDQHKVAMTEHHEAKQERRLAERLMGHKKTGRQQRRAAMIAKWQAVANQAKSRFFGRLAHQAHQLRVKTSQQEKLSSETRRVFQEAGRARTAVHEALGHTLVGAEVSELLREAQLSAKAAAVSQRKEAAASKREIQSMVKLEQELRSTP